MGKNEEIKQVSPQVFWFTVLLFAGLTFFWLWLYTYHRQAFQSLSHWSGNILNLGLIVGILDTLIFISIFFRLGKLQPRDFWLSNKSIQLGIFIGFGYWVILQLSVLVYVLANPNGSSLSNLFIGSYELQKQAVKFPASMINAFVEELLIRGFLFTQLWLWLKHKWGKQFWSVLGAAFFSALIWAPAHLPSRILISKLPLGNLLIEQLGLLALGILFALFYWRTKNLILMTIIHALNNSPIMLFKSNLLSQGIAAAFAVVIALFWHKIGPNRDCQNLKKIGGC